MGRVFRMVLRVALFSTVIYSIIFYYNHSKHTTKTNAEPDDIQEQISSVEVNSTFTLNTTLTDDATQLSNQNSVPEIQLFDNSTQTTVSRSTNGQNVIFYAYQRGGSSIGSEMFNLDPNTFLWYEPLDSFYSSYFGLPQETLPSDQLSWNNGTKRELLREERKWLLHFFRNMFECKLSELPPDLFAHDFIHKSDKLRGFTECYQITKKKVSVHSCRAFTVPHCGTSIQSSIENQCPAILEATRLMKHMLPSHYTRNQIPADKMQTFILHLERTLTDKGVLLTDTSKKHMRNFIMHQICVNAMHVQVSRCLPNAHIVCTHSPLHVTKLVRLRLEDIEDLSYMYPLLKVIYFPRDPRGIANSRYVQKFAGQRRNFVEEAQFVCQRMENDLRKKTLLEKRYPGKIFTIKYETLAVDLVDYARQVYEFLGYPVPEPWIHFVHMNYGRSDDSTFGLARFRPLVTAMAWKDMISPRDGATLHTFCRKVLQDLEYIKKYIPLQS